ncbi:MAG: hypothetical protein Q9169_007338 [Polycauliona sp. 2 TL-2023]
MPAFTASLRLRAIGLTLVALAAILALLVTHKSHQPSHESVNDIVIRQPASINVSAVFQPGTSETISSTRLGNVALPFGRPNQAFNFSSISKSPLVKRVLGARWKCYVEKGRKYYQEGVLPAFDGQSAFPTPSFTEDDLKANGWDYSDPIEEPLPLHWVKAFELVPEGQPTDEEERDDDVNRVAFHQCSRPAKYGATYYALYLPNSCAIITSVSYSPQHELEQADVPEDQIPSRLPPLHQLSDALWAEWDELSDFPGNLRYYAVEGIKNIV